MADRQGRNGGTLKDWEPGQSGNPAGKPRGTEHSRTRLRRLLEAVQKAKHPVTGQTEEFTTLELLDAKMIAKVLKSGDVAAYRELLDRLEGKAAQSIELTGKDGGPVQTESWIIEIEKPPTDGTSAADANDAAQNGD